MRKECVYDVRGFLIAFMSETACTHIIIGIMKRVLALEYSRVHNITRYNRGKIIKLTAGCCICAPSAINQLNRHSYNY